KCKCSEYYAEQNLHDYKIYVNDQINLFKSFEKEWTVKLELIARYWKNKIDALNTIYRHTKRYNLQFLWPDLSWSILEEHYRNIYEFQTYNIDRFMEGLRERKTNVLSTQQQCIAIGQALNEYREEFVRKELAKGIRCAPVIGNTTTINLPFFKMQVFISTGSRDLMAIKTEANFPFLSGEHWWVSKSGSESSGGKVGIGLGPVSGEVWGDKGGDWGAAGSIDFIAVVSPLGKLPAFGKSLGGITGEATGKAAEKIIGKSIKSEFKFEWKVEKGKGLSKGINVKFEPTVGYEKKSGVPPPGWIRLHSRAREKDQWPRINIGEPIPKLPKLPKMCP
ncbi:MAG: hypothetical protein GXO97_09625, partial [Nitrospirae bacterium]|nr:hypothetical protein [Nitrospirota bacterium]